MLRFTRNHGASKSNLVVSGLAIVLMPVLATSPVVAQVTAGTLGQATEPPATTLTRAQTALISELRTQGPTGDQDSFVELYNPSPEPLDVTGWSLQFLTDEQQQVAVTIPAGVAIPAYGHLLFTGRQYSLNVYAVGDVLIKQRIVGGVKLCDAAGKTVDAVGPASANASASANVAAYREGTGLLEEAFNKADTQFSCLRRFRSGEPQDTADNKRDFHVVAVSGTLAGKAVRLGAPGPENLASPILYSDLSEDDVRPIALTKPGVRERLRVVADKGPNKTYGTLILRHRFVNHTQKAIERLQFHVTGITAGAAPTGMADLRLLNADKVDGTTAAKPVDTKPTAAKSATAAPGAIPVLRAQLDEPPAQPRGGGLNTRGSVVMVQGGLAPKAAVDLEFFFGVEQRGKYLVTLGGEFLDLTFEGHSEASETPRLANAGLANGGSQRSGAAKSGTPRSGRGTVSRNGIGIRSGGMSPVRAPSANPAGAANAVMMATIIMEGHTEDGVEPPAKPSLLKASTFSAERASGTIRLRFNGALDANAASDPSHYTVEINGRTVAIETAAYDTTRSSVVLTLPTNSLRPGDTILIKWSNLADAQGRIASGQAGPLKVR